ncbi:hypothetical protein [Paraburkholderia sp. BL23I1N1]|uniref:hypothetical protein n=1 Tax=Paraburkholderia sp. BL23I1N1 TaxID=1938802 RepID=UPI00217D33F6|nr:hypothetical protein [Paraburkholderia sp. BL23I1N1]
MHHDDHTAAGFVLVILGMMVGFFAGTRTREYGMIGFGGMMGLVAYLILEAWGWPVLIGVWVALIAAQWAMDAIKGRRKNGFAVNATVSHVTCPSPVRQPPRPCNRKPQAAARW